MRLRFQAAAYGPFADNLHKVLEVMEGHFTRRFQGDRSPTTEIEAMPGGLASSERELAQHPASMARLERVARLMEGFETPYGMELLATVHWLATHNPPEQRELKGILEGVRKWNRRKGDLFTEHHVGVALARLGEENWLPV